MYRNAVKSVPGRVSELLKAELVEHYDIRVAAERIEPKLTPEERDYMVERGLLGWARNMLTDLRRGHHGPSSSSRMDGAKKARSLDVVALWTGTVEKPLRDCTLPDLTLVADSYTAQIGALEARVGRVDKVRKAMRKHKAEVAGDLPDDLLERLWFDA